MAVGLEEATGIPLLVGDSILIGKTFVLNKFKFIVINVNW